MDIKGSSLYELNQQLMRKEKILTSKELKQEISKKLKDYFTEKYYMLLCHEERDYTIFNLFNVNENALFRHNILEDLYECLINRGQVQSLDKLEDGAIEIWIKKKDTSYAYYLFPCSPCVIETRMS